MWSYEAIKPSSLIEIASDDNHNEKLWILWRHVKIKKCKSCNINHIPLTKTSHFSEFLSWIMQNTRKGWTREKGRDLTQSYDKSPYTNRNVKRAKWQHKEIKILNHMKKFYFFGVKYTVFIKNENKVLKNSDFCDTWSNDHIQYKFQISELSNKSYPIGITFFSIISIQNNLILIGYDFKMSYLLEYWLDR